MPVSEDRQRLRNEAKGDSAVMVRVERVNLMRHVTLLVQ